MATRVRVTDIALALVVLLGAQSASAQEARLATTGQCLMGREAYAVTDVDATTTNTAFALLPGSTIPFIQGAGGSCVAVRLSVIEHTGGAFRVVLDGTRYAIPQNNVVLKYTGNFSFEWIFPNVTPGNHTLTIQWRTTNPPYPVSIGIRTITVRSR